MIRLVAKMIVGLLLLTSCTGEYEPTHHAFYELEEIMSITISPSQARAWMEVYPEAIVLDVRTPAEFATGHIRNAILLPVDELAARAIEKFPDKDALIMVYCRSGVRSLDAAHRLVALGFTNVHDFGGIIDWPYGIFYR